MKHSKIYSYDKITNEKTDIHLSYKYLMGSHDLNWNGITIEKLLTLKGTKQEIYFKDYIFVIALDDISFSINNEIIDTIVDDVFINPMKSSYQLEIKDTFTGIMMSVSHDFLKAFFYDKNIDTINFIENYQVQDNNLNYLIKLILQQALEKTDYNDTYLKQLFSTFVTYFIKNFSDYQSHSSNHILNQDCLVRIDQYIDDNFDNQVNYKDISTLSGMSSYTFLNEFKALTNYTPHQYILNRKLKKAKELLLNSPLTITEISYELGFTDSSHFSKFFKKHTNISPSNYKSHVQEKP